MINEKLFKDLCAKLPYDIKCLVKDKDNGNEKICVLKGIDKNGFYLDESVAFHGWNSFELKPYLFPLSSMTEKQKQEVNKLVEETAFQIIHSEDGNPQPHIAMDWYNKNHFDYRGLIDDDSAIDATNLNIY